MQPWAGTKIDKVAGVEARGFILGGAVAHQLSAGFVPIRKKGKLPHTTVSIPYSLEYGLDHMEMHEDAVAKGERVILVDDLIATGGTAEGAVKLLRQMGAEVVAACFVIDLPDLGGAAKLEALESRSAAWSPSPATSVLLSGKLGRQKNSLLRRNNSLLGQKKFPARAKQFPARVLRSPLFGRAFLHPHRGLQDEVGGRRPIPPIPNAL